MSRRGGTLVIITPAGTVERTEYPTGVPLEALQAAVGGYVERVRVRFNGRVRDAYVNEDGIAKGLRPNHAGTSLMGNAYLLHGGVMRGNLAVWVPAPKAAA